LEYERTKKKKEKDKNALKAEATHPRCVKKHGKTLFVARMCGTLSTRHGVRAVMRKYNFQLCFICGFGEKAMFFTSNSTENLSINIRALIRSYSFRTWRFKRKN